MPAVRVHQISRDVREGICNVLGRASRVQLLQLFQVESRPGKLETKVVAVSEYSLQILTAKAPVKIEQSINFFDIKTIESPAPNKVIFVTDTKKVTIQKDDDSSEIDDMIGCILETLVLVFPAAFWLTLAKLTMTPPSRLNEITNKLQEVQSKDSGGPCGSFAFAYHCMCDYHSVPFSEEVAWDIDTIYLSHASTELTLSDFDHLDAKLLTPIVAALEHNSWFTKLNLSNVKLTPEAATEVLNVLRSNTTIKELGLSNTGLKWDYMQKLASALQLNGRLALTGLNLSGNAIEDRGLAQLLPAITKFSTTLITLGLSRTSISAKGVNRLAEIMSKNDGFGETLDALDLAENSLKSEELVHLHNFLSMKNVLTNLNLAGTDCSLETLFSALARGCTHKMAWLDLSRNVYSSKKSREQPLTWKDFFSSVVALQFVNLASCRLPSEALKYILIGLNANPHLKNLEFNLSGNNLGASGCQVLECFMAENQTIRVLDISDNGFDHCLVPLLAQLGKNKHLKKLAIGRNANIRTKHAMLVMDALVSLIQNEHSSLECLLLDDMKLKGDLLTLLAALGSNTNLREIDISGNMAGDTGARFLSKALAMNKRLTTIHWDRNGTTAQGFGDIASALQKNFTLKKMPVPLTDVSASARASSEKMEQALQKIDSALQRNQTPQRVVINHAYRLHHGLMSSSTQHMIDNTVIQMQDVISSLSRDGAVADHETGELIAHAQSLIKDVIATRNLLLEFQSVIRDTESESGIVATCLKSTAAQLQNVIQKQLEVNSTYLMQHTEKHCPSVFNNTLKDDLKSRIAEQTLTTESEVRELVTHNLGNDVLNSIDETSFEIANVLSNKLIEQLMISLDSTLQSLQQIQSKSTSDEAASTPATAKSKKQEVQQPNDVSRLDAIRASMYCRKLRPQSSFNSTPQVLDAIGDRRKATDLQEALRADSTSHTETVQKPTMKKIGTTRSIFAPSFDLDTILPDADLPKLSHPAKDRPKMRKTHYVKRAVVACESLLLEEGDAEEVARYLGSQMTLSSVGEGDKIPSRKDYSAELTNLPSVAPVVTKPTANSNVMSPPVSAKPLSRAASENSTSNQDISQSKDQATMREELHLNLDGLAKTSNVLVGESPSEDKSKDPVPIISVQTDSPSSTAHSGPAIVAQASAARLQKVAHPKLTSLRSGEVIEKPLLKNQDQVPLSDVDSPIDDKPKTDVTVTHGVHSDMPSPTTDKGPKVPSQVNAARLTRAPPPRPITQKPGKIHDEQQATDASVSIKEPTATVIANGSVPTKPLVQAQKSVEKAEAGPTMANSPQVTSSSSSSNTPVASLHTAESKTMTMGLKPSSIVGRPTTQTPPTKQTDQMAAQSNLNIGTKSDFLRNNQDVSSRQPVSMYPDANASSQSVDASEDKKAKRISVRDMMAQFGK